MSNTIFARPSQRKAGYQGISISQTALAVFSIVKLTLTGIPIIWLPILWFWVMEVGDVYGSIEPREADIYGLAVLKSLVIFGILLFVLREQAYAKNVRLSPAYPYPFILALIILWLLFCVSTSLPHLFYDPNVFLTVILLQLASILIILPLYLGDRAIKITLAIYILMYCGYWLLEYFGLYQDYWLLVNSNRAFEILDEFIVFSVFMILAFNYVSGGRIKPFTAMQKSLIASNRSSFLLDGKQELSLPSPEEFHRWPLWRKLRIGASPPVTSRIWLLLIANCVLMTYLAVKNPTVTETIGLIVVLAVTMASWSQPMANQPLRAQCRRLFLQSSADTKAVFFQHYLLAQLSNFLPRLAFVFILAATISLLLQQNYAWIFIFSVMGFLLGAIGQTQLEIRNAPQRGGLNAVWVAISGIVSVAAYFLFWGDSIDVMVILVLAVLLLAWITYYQVKRFCESEFEF